MRATLELTFDRGTLLVGGAVPLDLPGLVWDPRVSSFRAPAFRYAELVAGLTTAGYVVRDGVAPILGGRALDLREAELRAYQQDALLSWRLAGERGTVVLPTGGGKTHVALAAMARLRRPTLVLVPTRVLLGQWLARIREVYDGPLGVYGDGQRSLAPVTVSTFESAYRHMDDVGHRFGLLVVDEVHHFASGARAEALEMCAASARLGLTATPPDNAAGSARLEQLVGPVACHVTIADLSGRHLAPFDHARLFVGLGVQELEVYRSARRVFSRAFRQFKLQRGGGRSWADFIATAGATHEGREALRCFHLSRQVVSVAAEKIALACQLLRRHRGERALVFTADNAAAYVLSRRLLIPAITCDIGRAEREQVLDGLRRGRLRAVVSSRVLNEGLDLPEARVGIITGGSHGAREHVQRVGRLLRPGAGKRAVVYEIVARGTFEEQHSRRRERSLAS